MFGFAAGKFKSKDFSEKSVEVGLERSSVARHVVVQTRGDMVDQNLIVYNIDVFEGTTANHTEVG